MAHWSPDLPPAETYAWGDERLDGLVRAVTDAPEVALDTETTGLNNVSDHAVIWSLAFGRRRVCMRADTLRAFKRVFLDPSRTWIFHNAKFDAHMLANLGFTIEGRWLDTAVMHALLYEEASHKLKDVHKQLFGWTWAGFQQTFGKFPESETARVLNERWETDPSRVIEYASNDAFGTLNVKIQLYKELENELIFSLFPEQYPNMLALYEGTEVPFTKVLWKCERNGMKVDFDYLASIAGPVNEELAHVQRETTRLAGELVNIDSPAQLRRLFFEKMKLTPTHYTKGGKKGVREPSTDADFLEANCDIPLVASILRERELGKLKGTYIDTLPTLVDRHRRMHPTYNQDVARCMPAGEPVLTRRGYIPVEEVRAGDLVLSHAGVPRKVTETSQHAPQPIYRVQLSNGCVLRTTGNHAYHTPSGWVRADALAANAVITTHSAGEEWRQVPDWPTFQVSSWGRVRSLRSGCMLTQRPKGRWGHLKVTLRRNGAQRRGENKKDVAVHRLVQLAFAGQPPAGRTEVRHLNGIAWDNTAANLAWGSSHENRQDARRHGTMSQRRAGRSHLREEDVREIRAQARQPARSPNAKLNYELAEKIRVEAAPPRQTAKTYGISYAAAWNILHGKTYQHPERSQNPTAADLAKRFGVSAGHIRMIQAGTKWEDETHVEGSRATFQTAHVVDVRVEPSEVTYGLTVEVDHSHVTGGIVTHNTGRLSAKNPNSQNFPNADNDKFGIRGAFTCEPGNLLIVIDYSALEMRLLAAASREADMLQIFRDGKDIHMGNASMVFGIPYDDLVKAKKTDKLVKEGKLPPEAMTEYFRECVRRRGEVKSVGFGMNYGLKENKLAQQLGITKQEALDLMGRYMARYPAVQHFYDSAIASCRDTLRAYSILGRRRYLPEIWSTKSMPRWQAERRAVNMEIQGGAADIVRLAMLACDRLNLDGEHGCYMLAQVHDELVFECPIEEAEVAKEKIIQAMMHPLPRDLDVALEVSAGTGPNWKDAK